jgi:hypothetical protein
MNSIDEIADDLIKEEATTGSIALWAISDNVRWELALSSDEEVKTRSLDVVRILLDHGLWPGNFQGHGSKIQFWDEPDAAACAARIDREWDATKGDPTMTDAICWFKMRKPPQ